MLLYLFEATRHMATDHEFIRHFRDISLDNLAEVGGKTASLGELFNALTARGIRVPDGFAITAAAFRYLLSTRGAADRLREILAEVDGTDVRRLQERAALARATVTELPLPPELATAILAAYRELSGHAPSPVAVRSSATAEDLPTASFAGQQESFLNVVGDAALLDACQRCFASLFTDRAISYRLERGFDHLEVSLSIAVQRMVRADAGSSGVIFTVDPESGFTNAILITGVFGLGETIVKGRADPDEFVVFKPTLRSGARPIIGRKIGTKRVMLVTADDEPLSGTREIPTPPVRALGPVLPDDEILCLARWALEIEDHYSARAGRSTPMDIEWARDGVTGELFILQARPETVVSRRDPTLLTRYRLTASRPAPLVSGRAVGQQAGTGRARILQSPAELGDFAPGEVLVAAVTDPDWEPIMKRAAGIVTDHGGRTSHAAIVSRELGIPCVVGTGAATARITPGAEITLDCTAGETGVVYPGRLPFTIDRIPQATIPVTRTRVQLNLGDPEQAFGLSFLPHDGVGLVREEFIVGGTIGIHPLALLHLDRVQDQAVRARIEELTRGYTPREEYFIDRLAVGIGRIVAAVHPKPALVRLGDFKSNEYAHLIGGAAFEPHEQNPMIGWRGASRYAHPDYAAAFALECRALRRVREEFGLQNMQIMVPFCRTVEEGCGVLELLARHGLRRGEQGLEIFVMCETPSNALLAREFLEHFDGFSIGSNDLTQLTLGVDRDSELVAALFDERNPAVLRLIELAIAAGRAAGRHIGICGDAPSTWEDFTRFLVQRGIDSISVSPDVLLRTRLLVAAEEARLGAAAA